MAREPTAPVEDVAPPGSAPPWAFFACGGQGYAVRLDRIHEIVPPQPVTRLPGCGPAVCGLIGLRGRVITVFDLGVLVGGPPATEGPGHRLLLIRREDRIIGLAVEELLTIAALPEWEAGAAGGDGAPSVLRVGDRTFHVLDPDRLLGPLLA